MLVTPALGKLRQQDQVSLLAIQSSKQALNQQEMLAHKKGLNNIQGYLMTSTCMHMYTLA